MIRSRNAVVLFNYMVEYTSPLDIVFHALADPIRRDIIAKVTQGEYSVGELVAFHHVSFAAISKHLKVLEEAGLIQKRKDGRYHMVSLVSGALAGADDFLHSIVESPCAL